MKFQGGQAHCVSHQIKHLCTWELCMCIYIHYTFITYKILLDEKNIQIQLSMNIRHIKFLKLYISIWTSGIVVKIFPRPGWCQCQRECFGTLHWTFSFSGSRSQPSIAGDDTRLAWTWRSESVKKLEWSERSSVDEWKTGEWDIYIYFARTYLQYKQIWYILYTYALHTCICCIDNHWESISNNHY